MLLQIVTTILLQNATVLYYLFVTFIFVFENSQNSFSCGPTFGPFLYLKYLNFGQMLPIRTSHHTFLDSIHSEVFKNLYYVLFYKVDYKYNQNFSYYTGGTLCQQLHPT